MSPEITMNAQGCCACSIATTELKTSHAALIMADGEIYIATKTTQVISLGRYTDRNTGGNLWNLQCPRRRSV